MTTSFVFGNSPIVNNLLDFIGKDEKSGDPVTIKSAEFKQGHYMININDHPVGVLCNEAKLINAIYSVDDDYEGIRLFTNLMDQWSVKHTTGKIEPAIAVADDDMGLFFNYL